MLAKHYQTFQSGSIGIASNYAKYVKLWKKVWKQRKGDTKNKKKKKKQGNATICSQIEAKIKEITEMSEKNNSADTDSICNKYILNDVNTQYCHEKHDTGSLK